jgi:hypothetical protein
MCYHPSIPGFLIVANWQKLLLNFPVSKWITVRICFVCLVLVLGFFPDGGLTFFVPAGLDLDTSIYSFLVAEETGGCHHAQFLVEMGSC